jgi:hypothetical protein
VSLTRAIVWAAIIAAILVWLTAPQPHQSRYRGPYELHSEIG